MSELKWLNPNVASLIPYEPGRPIEEVARELGMDPDSIVKMASNENPLGPSTKATRAMKKAVGEMNFYPDGGAYFLRERLAGLNGVSREQVIVGSGSNEILEFIGHCFMGPGKKVVASQYAFIVYKLVAKMFGSPFVEVPAKAYGHNLRGILNAIDEDTSVVFICNPNNPTGTFLKAAQIRNFMARVPEHVLVVFDEAYAEIALGRMPKTVEFVHEGRNCMVLHTFSKAYGLAGLRVGYGIGPKPVVTALQKARQPFNVTRMGQIAALAALDDHGFLRKARRLFRQGKAYLEAELAEMGLEYIPTAANFLLVKVGDGIAVTQKLTERGVIVRPMAGYGLPEFLRISFGTMEENKRCITELKAIMADMNS